MRSLADTLTARPRREEKLRCGFRGVRQEFVANDAEGAGIRLARLRIEEVRDVLAITLAVRILPVPLQHCPLHERIEDVVIPSERRVLLAECLRLSDLR